MAFDTFHFDKHSICRGSENDTFTQGLNSICIILLAAHRNCNLDYQSETNGARSVFARYMALVGSTAALISECCFPRVCISETRPLKSIYFGRLGAVFRFLKQVSKHNLTNRPCRFTNLLS